MTARPELIEDQVLPAQPLDWVDDEDDDDEIYYYYDYQDNSEELRQRDMSGTGHEMLKQYLMAVISWLFRLQKCAVYGELNFYRTNNRQEKPLYPDVAVLKDQEWRRLRSYRLNLDGPPPNLVIEIISDNTRRKDLYTKPKRYASWGTAEYFVYDERERKRRSKVPRLSGWRLNEDGEYAQLSSTQPDGRMWSEQLQCWFVPDDMNLWLHDRDDQRLSSKAEAYDLLAAEFGRQAEVAEALRHEAEEANERVFRAQRRVERLAQRLRELGEDPESL